MKPKFYFLRNLRDPEFPGKPGFRIYSRALFLFYFAFISCILQAQTTPLSFTSIPFSNPDLVAPGRGAEHWMQSDADFDGVNNVFLPTATGKRTLNYYKRINWGQIENAGSGTTPASSRWNWSVFDQEIHYAIDHGQKFSFGILPIAQSYDPYNAAGSQNLSYPTWLHNKMQTESTKDWLMGNDWVPDWNSPSYLDALDSLNYAIAYHLANTTYKGVLLKDAVFYIDIRGYGNFGEWHMAGYTGGIDAQKAAGRMPTIASYKRIIDSHKKAFADYHLVCIMNTFDSYAGNSSIIPPEIVNYALTQSNNKGLFGWRRDNWGANFYDDVLYNNTTTYNGWRADTAIRNRWQFAPVVGEPNNGAVAGMPSPYADLPREVRLYHANSFGNNNYYVSASSSTAMQDSVRMASKLSGYRLVLEGGSISSTLSGGMPFTISLNWHNVGLAPAYYDWIVQYELRNASNQAVWTGTSSFTPSMFLPSPSAKAVSDNFTLPAGIAQGTYTMVMIVRDPAGYSTPLVLAINGRQTDGSYPLATVNVGIASNQPPTANAGPDQTITAPASSVTLQGSGTDPDGSIKSYSWTMISGQAGASIQSPASATTQVNSLAAGVFFFRLTVTDNMGAMASDTVKVTVNAANQPPVANAGSNQTITLPVSSANLNGSASSDPDGSISSYAWSKVSGPASFSITNAAAASTTVSGLVQGTYIFKLTVTDNQGASSSANVTITVNPAPNQPPVANAGSNQTITLPVSTVTLNGSASSDPDGTISSYAWSKLSGPASFSITSPTTVSTTVTGLLQGTYVFRLTVTDNLGATSTSDVTITVNAVLASNQPPVANAGNNQTITLPASTVTLSGTASSDPDGTISSYAWSKVSGPTSFSITSPAAVSTTVSGLVQGVYVFKLTVTDNQGASSSANVTITVNPSPNQPPVANAGADISVNLPVSSVSLNGSGSYDPDGSIAAYNWAKISGPGALTIVNSTTARPSVVGLLEGSYVFELTVTDNGGATATDRVTVVVGPAPNATPVANAGTDTSLSVPTSSVLLNGSGSKDPDGTISSYSWKQLSGPSNALLASPGAATTLANNLVPGEYQFGLTVTDNRGASASASVRVTVVDNLRAQQDVFIIYPNPGGSNVNLRCISDTLGQCQLNFYFLNGSLAKSLLFTKSVNYFEHAFQINELNAGTYVVEIIIEGKKRMLTKFIKQ